MLEFDNLNNKRVKGLNEPDIPSPEQGSSDNHRYIQRMRASLNAIAQGAARLQQAARPRQELNRIYFLDAKNGIIAAEFFAAPGDAAAARVATFVQDASGDVSKGYELWCKMERIAVSRYHPETANDTDQQQREDVSRAHQDIIVDLEDRLQRSFICLARSRNLVEVATKIRAQSKM